MKGLPIKMYTARPANGRNNQVAQKCQRFLYVPFFLPSSLTFPLPYLNFKSRHIFYTFSFEFDV
jgi:hypothetical protein